MIAPLLERQLTIGRREDNDIALPWDRQVSRLPSPSSVSRNGMPLRKGWESGEVKAGAESPGPVVGINSRGRAPQARHQAVPPGLQGGRPDAEGAIRSQWALHAEKESSSMQDHMSYGELLAWLRQWKQR